MNPLGRALPLIADLVVRVLPEREVIGPPDCALVDRWTLLSRSSDAPKLLLHHFLPEREDIDCHDHPRGFITFVFRGGYDDLVVCPACNGQLIVHDPELADAPAGSDWQPCLTCMTKAEGPRGLIVGDRLRAGSIRLRRAEYAHATRTGRSGAWTLCLMFPVSRPWGFWRAGVWWPFREYEKHFGMAMRCEDRDTVHYGWDGTGAGEGG